VILVDTSLWVEHLRRGSARLERRLLADEVAVHPFVVGEIALGALRRRREVLDLLAALPAVSTASHAEAMALVERHGLAGAGIGWVDAHLLASASLARLPLATLDRRLAAAAARLDLFAEL
jgi:predicted nucleic acid-binding protein